MFTPRPDLPRSPFRLVHATFRSFTCLDRCDRPILRLRIRIFASVLARVVQTVRADRGRLPTLNLVHSARRLQRVRPTACVITV